MGHIWSFRLLGLVSQDSFFKWIKLKFWRFHPQSDPDLREIHSLKAVISRSGVVAAPIKGSFTIAFLFTTVLTIPCWLPNTKHYLSSVITFALLSLLWWRTTSWDPSLYPKQGNKRSKRLDISRPIRETLFLQESEIHSGVSNKPRVAMLSYLTHFILLHAYLHTGSTQDSLCRKRFWKHRFRWSMDNLKADCESWGSSWPQVRTLS